MLETLLWAGIPAELLGFHQPGYACKAARPYRGRAVAGYPPVRARGGRRNGTCHGGGGGAEAAQGFRA